MFASPQEYQIDLTNIKNGISTVQTANNNNIDFSVYGMVPSTNVTKENALIKNTTIINGIKKISITKNSDLNESNNVLVDGGWEFGDVIDYSYSNIFEFVDNNLICTFDYLNTGYPDYFKLTFKSTIEITNIQIVYSCISTSIPEDLTSNIPFVKIQSDDGKGVPSKNYVDTTISITNAGKNNLAPSAAQVKIRGNTTATKPKKPYRIKFDKKQKLFGKKKQKSWVLLADYLDPSALHNYTAFQLTNYFDQTAYSPLAQHVRVYLDDEYKGLYLLTEHPDEKEGRTNVPFALNEELTEFSYCLELDANAKGDPDIEKYFTISLDGHDDHYLSLNFPDKKDFLEYYEEEIKLDEETATAQTETAWNAFIDYLTNEVENMTTILNEKNYESMNALFDQDSLVDYTLIDLIMGEKDHHAKSFKFYRRMGEKIKFGPIWDYDWAMYTLFTGLPNVSPGMHKFVYNNFFKAEYFAFDKNKQVLADRWFDIGEGALIELQQILLDYAGELEMELYLDANMWYERDYNLVDSNVMYITNYIYDSISFLNNNLLPYKST